MRGAGRRQARGARARAGAGHRVSPVAAAQRLIRPHGGHLVNRVGERPDGVEGLERLTLTSREVSDLEMIATGGLSPLEGFMGRDDYERVVDEMRLANDLPWPL